MTELFNKQDVLTLLTADEDIIGTEGYFGDSIRDLIKNIEMDDVKTLVDIAEDDGYCFGTSSKMHYLFFLPKDKVKKPIYRALEDINELFAFMMPDFADKKYTTDEKIDMLLGLHYALKDTADGTIRYYTVNFLSISAYGTVILDDFDLTYLFDKYKYRKGDKFVPFGIKKE